MAGSDKPFCGVPIVDEFGPGSGEYGMRPVARKLAQHLGHILGGRHAVEGDGDSIGHSTVDPAHQLRRGPVPVDLPHNQSAGRINSHLAQPVGRRCDQQRHRSGSRKQHLPVQLDRQGKGDTGSFACHKRPHCGVFIAQRPQRHFSSTGKASHLIGEGHAIQQHHALRPAIGPAKLKLGVQGNGIH